MIALNASNLLAGMAHTTETTTTDPVEAAWIEAAREHPQAFAPLYERHAPAIYRFVYRKVSDIELANDLTAQIFIKAIERIHTYRPKPGATFRSWLFTIARNTITDTWRRQRPTADLDQHAATLVANTTSPEAHAIARDEQRAIQQLLAELPDSQRAVVELRLAGLSTSEIRATLNMSESAVKSAQHRAYRRLRERLTTQEGPRL